MSCNLEGMNRLFRDKPGALITENDKFEFLILKPSFFGVGIDLKQLFKRVFVRKTF